MKLNWQFVYLRSYIYKIFNESTIEWDPQDFGFLDPDPQKYADPRIRIQGGKYQPKTAKKTFLLLKPKSKLLRKERL